MLKLVQLRRIWYIQNMTELNQTKVHAFLGHANYHRKIWLAIFWILTYLGWAWTYFTKKLIISFPARCLPKCEVCQKLLLYCDLYIGNKQTQLTNQLAGCWTAIKTALATSETKYKCPHISSCINNYMRIFNLLHNNYGTINNFSCQQITSVQNKNTGS